MNRLSRFCTRLRALRVLCKGTLRRARLGAWCMVMSRIPAVALQPIAVGAALLRMLFDANGRALAVERADFCREVMKVASPGSVRLLAARTLESLIDRRLHFGRQRRFDEAWPDLQRVAGSLAQAIGKIRREAPGCPVIVSPFHYVSQYANIYVIDELRTRLGLARIGVVSGVPRDLYGSDDAMIPDIDVLCTYDQNNRSGLGLQVARSLRRHGVVVVFADVPPYTLHRYPMETVGVSIFGSAARIHNGVFRMGAPFGAVLLPFYLGFERGRFGATVLEPIQLADRDAPQRLARQIEQALMSNFESSLVTGHPSLYAFAAAK
ncbi:hypothetical protein G3N95_30985 [Paraburkholderia sp. Tr-20389]|uniref:hypothetical protein n=1 Tax=Paraburkholderia sp. Tr-20389 TaxID=2703903 RepID=UPI0019816E47|nr:hypothetical protein [Paraburkholderia sp. Tr-20389]MBN3757394.1 hypothetical protein [Paraburkholderia sp. Tr-20389]